MIHSLFMATVSNQVQKIIRHYVPMIRFKYGANRAAPTTPAKPTETLSTYEFFETPTRYRRRPLTSEEIDLIKIGGIV